MDTSNLSSDTMSESFSHLNIKTFDISSIQNDFIYKLVDYYLEEISLEPSQNITESITNMVDTIMSFHLLAQKNGVIDVSNSRKFLALKTGKSDSPYYEQDNNLLDQCNKLSENFEEFEKYLINNKDKIGQNSGEIQSDIPQVDELLSNHELFMSEISKKTSNLRQLHANVRYNVVEDSHSTENVSGSNTNETNKTNDTDKTNETNDTDINNKSTPDEVIDKMTILQNKLNSDIQSVEETLRKNKQHDRNTNIISLYDIEAMSKNNIVPNKIQTVPNKTLVVSIPEHDEKKIIQEKDMNNLEKAFNNLHSRLNTPFVNLSIAVVLIKITIYLFGF